MDKPILYYWPPCGACAAVRKYAEEHGIEFDLRDVEQVEPYEELLALGGDANKIPCYYDGERLIQGRTAVLEYLQTLE